MLNFPITADAPLSSAVRALDIHDFAAFIAHVQALPYGRTSDRSRPVLILQEKKGTCSSKHALLKLVADEHHHPELKLVMGLYKMTRANTPGIGSGIEEAGLAYLPEAHCYLKLEGKPIDITTPASDFDRIRGALLHEEEIAPAQIGAWKVAFHQDYLRNWITDMDIDLSFEAVWAIRESCIAHLGS